MEEKVVESNSSQNVNIRKDKIISYIKKQIKKPEVIALMIILIATFITGIYYFNLTKDQALWYDEGTYLGKANQLAFGYPLYPINAGRALGDVFLYAGLFKLGLNEVFIRFMKIIFAVVIIFMIYYLGKEMFNKWIGLFAAFAMSANWVFWYVNTRIFPDESGLFYWLLMCILFYKGYISKNAKPIYLWILGPVFAYAIYVREFNGYFAFVVLIYLLFTDQFKFLKNKNNYIALGLMVLVLLPFFYYYQVTWGNPFSNILTRLGTHQLVANEVSSGIKAPDYSGSYLDFILNAKDYMGGVLIILFLVGLTIFFNLFVGFDLFIKGKAKDQNNNFFLFLWILVVYLISIFYVVMYDERYLFVTFPALFYISGNGMYIIYNWIKKYNKIIGIIVVLGILIMIPFYSFLISWGGGPVTSQFERGDSLIKGKIDSYWQAKAAGLWLKENANKKDRVLAITDSPPQLNYFSEIDIFVSYNLTNLTKFINENKPKYLYIDATSDPAGKNYIQENINAFKPVAGWPVQKGDQIQQGNIFSIMYLIDYTALNAPKNVSTVNNIINSTKSDDNKSSIENNKNSTKKS